MRRKRAFFFNDMTPLIDIVFLLLIFFMATTVFKEDELALSLTLPKASEAGKSDKPVNLLRIVVTQDKMALNDKLVNLGEIKGQLQKLQDKELPIELKIDQSVQYQRIIDVLDTVKSLGFYNIDLITKKEALSL
jgi:biopolymer transport protein ExbD